MKINNYSADTLLKSAVVSPQLPKALDHVAHVLTYAPRWKTEFRVIGDKNASKRFTNADPIERACYNAKDAWMTDFLDDALEPHLEQVFHGAELYQDYLNLNLVGIQMRRDGVLIIRENIEEHSRILKSRARYARRELRELAASHGYSNFNPNAPEQVKGLFFEKYGIIPSKWSEKTGAASLDKGELTKALGNRDKEVRRAANLLLKYKKWMKLYSSYIKNLPIASDNRVHPTWNVSGAKTGRWSCQDPALMTIPKPVYSRGKDGKERVSAPGLRNLFGASKDYTLIEVDYRQFEAYTIALMSGDKKLKELLDTGDVHSATAKIIFGLDDKAWEALAGAVKKKFREMAKRARYALHYGAEPETAWRALVGDYPDLTLSQILRLFSSFKRLHPDIIRWQQEQVAFARKHLFIQGPVSGRRYQFWGEVEASACYNIPNQMTVADVINDVIGRLVKQLAPGERLLAQVHDSILAEAKDPIRLARKIKEACEKPVTLNGVEVIFAVDVKVGPNWGELEELKL